MNADHIVDVLRAALPTSPLFDGGMPEDLHLLFTLGDVAKQQTLPAFRRREGDRSMGRDQLDGAWTKDDGSWVSRADLIAERAVRSAVHVRCPQDSILGEEDGLTPGHESTTLERGSDRRQCLVLVRLRHLGDIDQHAGGRDNRTCAGTIAGARGVVFRDSTARRVFRSIRRGDPHGATDRGHQQGDIGKGALALSGVAGLATLPRGDGTMMEDAFVHVRNGAAHWRKLGNSLSPTQVARGVAVAGWGSDLSPAYDVPTTELLVTEAGGRVTQLPRPPTRGGRGVTILYSNAVIHDQLLSVLRAQ